MYVMVDDAGRIVAASLDFHCGEGEVEVEPPEGFDIEAAHEWRVVDGVWVREPVAEVEPEVLPAPVDEVAALRAEVAELREALDLLLSGEVE